MWNRSHQRSFRKLNRNSFKDIEDPSVQQYSKTENLKLQKKFHQKLDRSFKITGHDSNGQYDSSSNLKAQENNCRTTTQIRSSFKAELPLTPNINRTSPNVSSLNKKIAIVSPIPRNNIMEYRALRFQDSSATNQNVRKSTSVSLSRSKSIPVHRPYSSVSNTSSQSPKTLATEDKEIAIIKVIPGKWDNSTVHKNRLKLPSSVPRTSSVTTSKGKVVQIGKSPALTALERKRKQQQRLQMCLDEKNPKCTGGNASRKKIANSACEGKSLNATCSLQSAPKSSVLSKSSNSLLARDKSAIKTTSTDGAFSHRNQKTNAHGHFKPASFKSVQNCSTPLPNASKIVRLTLSPARTNANIRTPSTLTKPRRESSTVPCNKASKSEVRILTPELPRHRFKPYASPVNDSSGWGKSAHSSLKDNNSFNKTPKDRPVSKNLKRRAFQRNSPTFDNVSSPSELKSARLDSRNISYSAHQPNNSVQIINSSSANTSSRNSISSPCTSTNAQFIIDQEKYSNDVEMEDVSITLPSLTSLTCSMEADDLSLLDNKHYSFVVDTNVFMHHLSFIDELKDTPIEGSGPPFIFVPWVVFSELDKLKSKDSPQRMLAVKAVKYLHSMLESNHPRIHGQPVKLAHEIVKMYGKQNDDVILAFCDVLATKTSKEKTGLITNDVNLCNRALVSKINAYTTESLFTKLKADVRVIRSDKNIPDFPSSANKDDAMVLDNPLKATKVDVEVDKIICEAKLILREVLGPFLKESMKTAFGDLSESFMTPLPISLQEILGCYNKYWVSVFGILFQKNVRTLFDSVRNIFFKKKAYFCDVKDAFPVMHAVENICKAIAVQKPSVEAQVQEISQLIDACNKLAENRKAEEDETTPIMKNKSQNEITLGIFNHLWELINYLSGMIMDFAGLPHQYKYSKPTEIPSKAEFSLLISNFCPALHTIKEGMSKVIEVTTLKEQEKHEIDYKRLYNYLLQFVPSLQIQANPPPADGFNVQCLKDFMINQENRETIKNGFRQLVGYQKDLVQVIHLPIWKS